MSWDSFNTSVRFQFDPDKSTANNAKHGIDFIEAHEIWTDADWVRFRLEAWTWTSRGIR